jgi:hypothetical protein
VFIVNVFFYEGDAMCWIVGEKALALMNHIWTLNLLIDMANSAPHGLWCPNKCFSKWLFKRKKTPHYGNVVVCEPKLHMPLAAIVALSKLLLLQ